MSKNKIVDVREVEHLACLPCLEKLTLKRNPVTTIVDYRACVLELFLDRAAEVVYHCAIMVVLVLIVQFETMAVGVRTLLQKQITLYLDNARR